MSEIFFYHLTESKLDDTLPGLVEHSLQRGWRVVIQFATEERRNAIDALLWNWSDISFIAHGSNLDKLQEEQPVFLTTSTDNPNVSQVRFCVEGTQCHDPENYDRLVIMFDGHDIGQLARARQDWGFLKNKGHMLTCWQQMPNKRWKKRV
ncbi:MAG: DNA polymerase III subunit chi [Candidatus Tokpelaia sp. JSC188]|nr:MAG: DNA polymerase III subunit chi [Candidatus Tokpelaia sp. JSC188]